MTSVKFRGKQTDSEPAVEAEGTAPAIDGTAGGRAGTSGVLGVISGLPFWLRWASVAAGIAAINIQTTRSELSVRAPGVSVAAILIANGTAIAMVILLYPVVRLVCRWEPPWSGRPLRFLGTHALAIAAFDVAHVTGYSVLRTLIYAAIGDRYAWGSLGEYLGEAPNNAVAYGLLAALIWIVFALERRAAPPPQVRPVQQTLDIRDGAKIVRTPIASIVAVRSAGNYVEFHLADGRRPLMRATMAGVEASLLPHGFARSHRSWIVNQSRVVSIEPNGAGESRLTLTDGVEALLSRRFRKAVLGTD
jgi:hypothetical protein